MKKTRLFLGSVNFKESAGNPFEGQAFLNFLGIILTNLQSSSQNVKTGDFLGIVCTTALVFTRVTFRNFEFFYL